MLTPSATHILAAGSILVPALIAILVYRLQRRTKKFGYYTLFDQAVFKESDLWNGTLELRYRGTAVQNVHLISIFFENNGHLPITPEDQREPVVIDFGDQARILSAEVSAQRPSDLNIHVSAEGAVVSVSPVLLNRWDTFTLKILVSGYQKPPTIRGRIVGVEKIEMFRLGRGWAAAAVVGVAVSILCSSYRDDIHHRGGQGSGLLLIGSLAGIAFSIFSLIGLFRTDLVQLEKWRSRSKGSSG